MISEGLQTLCLYLSLLHVLTFIFILILPIVLFIKVVSINLILHDLTEAAHIKGYHDLIIL